MRRLWLSIDELLRGRYTKREELRAGRVDIPTRTLIAGGLSLGALYGVFMGLYAALRPTNPTILQLLATTVKLPLLFLLTLAVTIPSLYVFSALAESRLPGRETMRLLLAAIVVDLALLASLGPITAFFTLSTESYPFIVVLNVVFLGIAGLAGLVFLRRALSAVFEPPQAEAASLPPTTSPAPGASAEVAVGIPTDGPAVALPLDSARIPPVPGRRDPERALADRARFVFRVWMVIYGAVGAQMGWILRPFIGDPDRVFTWFRERESNFLSAVLRALRLLLG